MYRLRLDMDHPLWSRYFSQLTIVGTNEHPGDGFHDLQELLIGVPIKSACI
jgi:hypothetical protein